MVRLSAALGTLTQELHGQTMTGEQTWHSLRVGAPPAALRGHAQGWAKRLRSPYAGLVAIPVVMMNQAQIQGGVVRSPQVGQGAKIGGIRAIFRDWHVQEIDPSCDCVANPIRYLDHNRHIRWHDQMLIGGRAVAQMIAQVDGSRHGVTQPG